MLALVNQPIRYRILTLMIVLSLVGLIAILMAMDFIDLSTAVGWSAAMGIMISGVAVAFFLNIFLTGGLSVEEKKRMAVLAILFLGAAVFWAGFEQAGSSLSIFANNMTQRQLGDVEVPASWFQNLNPMFILILTPFMAKFWMSLQIRGWQISVFYKFGLALFLLGLGYWILVPAAQMALMGTKVSAMFLLGTYLIHTIAELLLSPVGLSTFSSLAPERFVSQLMGFWFVAASLGNLLAGLLASNMDTQTAMGLPSAFEQMFICSVVLGLVLILFAKPIGRWALVSKNLND